MEWNVYFYNSNRRKVETFNIFEHGSFIQYVEKWLKKCKTKEEFVEYLKSELMYYFWAKSEWELVVEIAEDNRIFLIPWCGSNNPDKEKIEVTNDTIFDWKAFAEIHTKRQIYGNKAKVDVHDQVMFKWEEFVEYVWNRKGKRYV